ncbi:MAG TPA: lipid A deacylase LpxR family protein [Longimicrobium sp.]|nr:lipid A deacylase LpxR family protein [Longimicrobium sp.]
MKLRTFPIHIFPVLAWAAACPLALAAAPAAAQVREVRLVLDNDAYDFWIPVEARPDEDYTNGIHLSVEMAGAPLLGRLLAPHAARCAAAAPADSACTATNLSFGQKIFTPEIDGESPVAGQRPYAGWLYASAVSSVQTARRMRGVGVEVGVTGRPSLGEAVQTTWHRIAGFVPPEGWENQLGFEPAFRVRYDEGVLLADVWSGGVRVATLAPAWGADVGTAHVGAHAGVAARVGWAVPHPWSAAADRGAGPVSVYATGRVRQDAVARDLFLDGSTFRRSIRVRRRPLVWEYELGAGARYRALTLEYRALTRGREYQTQLEPHTWGTFELRYRLR